MKAHLLFADQDLDLRLEDPPHAADLIADLELDTILDAMAAGDKLIRAVARAVLLHPLTDVAQINYRQHVLDDCLHHPEAAHGLYELAGEAIAAERSVWHVLMDNSPDSLLHRSVQVLELYVASLTKLRAMAAELAPTLRSDGFSRFFEMVAHELDDDYFAEITAHLKMLKFSGGQLVSARLGHGGQPVEFVLRLPKPENRTFFHRVALRKPTFSYTIPDRDEAGYHALSDLKDRSLNEVANATAQSCDHVLSFFHALRNELAFYLGCLNLSGQLSGCGAAPSYPTPLPAEEQAWSATNLYDVSLCLRMKSSVVANTVDADGARLIMVTGANRGGKSTFLRSVGQAALMTGAGMFVGAQQLRSATRNGVYTHFKREEDDTMSSGKFDEELARMSALAKQIRSRALLLCNESFQATNELEGSEIGRQVARALIDAGVTVVFVTHLYDLAHNLYAADGDGRARLFLRAERDPAGTPTFRVVPGEPLPTSHGVDLYDRIFAAHTTAAAATG